jgi:D-alanyl-lipoteichoic acid acyltransferase DltB (MBOAT superfamily)
MAMLATFSVGLLPWLPFVAFLGFGYVGFRLIERDPKRWFLPSIAIFVGAFFWLKQYTIVPSALFPGFSYPTVGLSYILFRVLHLMIDRRSEAPEQPVTFQRYLIYVINFTTLVSGPIQRYSDFAASAFAPFRPALTLSDVAIAAGRIITGLFKAQVAALILSELHNRALDGVLGHESSKVVFASLLFVSYTFFLYCNFSGYIDVVIGISSLLGIRLPENFNRPFSADSFIEFWNRWHITLSQWLKTYVYNPLIMSLMRRYPSPKLELTWALLAFFVTFVLIGVWHGQTATFLFFGFLQGFGVAANKLYQVMMIKRMGSKRYRAFAAKPLYVAVSRGFTFTWFTFTLIWFWSNWTEIGSIFTALGPANLIQTWLLIFGASTLVLAAWEALRNACLDLFHNPPTAMPSALVTPRYWKTAQLTLLIVITLAVQALSGISAPDIVYKKF